MPTTYWRYSARNRHYKNKKLDEVMVQAIRVNEKAPVSFSNFTKKNSENEI
ncbi:TonB-dependent receptor [Flavobacterium psychrophilum]|nr:TonB-dependent receptor [Flavobacterium psychrophilum]